MCSMLSGVTFCCQMFLFSHKACDAIIASTLYSQFCMFVKNSKQKKRKKYHCKIAHLTFQMVFEMSSGMSFKVVFEISLETSFKILLEMPFEMSLNISLNIICHLKYHLNVISNVLEMSNAILNVIWHLKSHKMSFPISESTETQMISKTDDGHVTSFCYQSKSTHVHSQTSLPRFKTKQRCLIS